MEIENYTSNEFKMLSKNTQKEHLEIKFNTYNFNLSLGKYGFNKLMYQSLYDYILEIESKSDEYLTQEMINKQIQSILKEFKPDHKEIKKVESLESEIFEMEPIVISSDNEVLIIDPIVWKETNGDELEIATSGYASIDLPENCLSCMDTNNCLNINDSLKSSLIKYKNLTDHKYVLKRSTDGSAGYDLYLDRCITDDDLNKVKSNRVYLDPLEVKVYGTGIAIELPQGYCADVILRSSVFDNKKKIMLSNCIGLIDNDYRGEIMLKLVNLDHMRSYKGPLYGERVAQLILRQEFKFETVEVDELSFTDRGIGGFGSTGV